MNPYSNRLAVFRHLSWIIAVLAAIASAVGLFAPTVYRETDWVIPQNRGQDLVTLIALVVLVWAQKAQRGRSPRALLIAFGILGYLAYTYTGAAFVYHFNELFPVYVALFSMTGAALIAGLSGIDVTMVRSSFDAQTPRRGVSVFLLIMAVMLCALWSSQIIPFYVDGTLPNMIVQAKTPSVYVYVLDLGVVGPLSLLAAWWLWCDRPWGFVLAGFVLVKAAAMGLALLCMTLFAWRAGVAVESTMTLAWTLLAIAGVSMSVWYFSHCRVVES